METLRQQVRRAQARLVWQQFFIALVWTMTGALVIATCGIAAAKIWPLDTVQWIWATAWIGGAAAVAILAAAFWTWVRRRGALDAAIEIDRRYGLKERVSSALALTPAEQETEAGRAVMEDALRRIGRIDVRERFDVSVSRRGWLPLVPALAAFALAFFVGDKVGENIVAATTTSEVRHQIKQSTEVLQRKLAEQKKEARDLNLPDAEGLFQKIEERVRELGKQDQSSRQNALVKLNDLAKELAERRQQLGADDKLKQQLDQLKNLQERGPADKLADAMKEGDFQKAAGEVEKLQQQLANQNLNEEQKAKLGDQLAEMKDKLQKLADAHEQVKQELEQQMQQARDAGKLAEADKLQQQLDKLERQAPQMERLQNLASKLGQAADKMKNGQANGAQEALDQLAGDLKQLQQEASELAMLDEATDQIEQAKDAMNCKACSGAGCKLCQGGIGREGEGKRGGEGPGGRAEGGSGERGEEKSATGMYDSKVDQNVRRGAATLTDFVEGPNIKGQAQQEIKAQMEAATRQAADPLIGQKLPRNQRDHAQQYFDSLREGK